MNTANYLNLNIGVSLVKHFPFMNSDSEILYGVNVNSKISGAEVVDSCDYDTDFFIYVYVGASNEEVFGICYTVESPQTQDTPADYDYRDYRTRYKTLDEAEVALAQMITERFAPDEEINN